MERKALTVPLFKYSSLNPAEAATSKSFVCVLIRSNAHPLIPSDDLMLSTVSLMTSLGSFNFDNDLVILMSVS